ncbi:MAG: hypothetical protein GXO83_06700 [Chlorobi bacterium]|nr:hypothetical protein [Chlorobiota bacterium]
MKQSFLLQQAGMMSVFLFGFGINLFSQEQPANQVNTGGDLVSNYIWRGTKFGSGPAIQPFVELSLGNFSIGAWGSYCFSTNEAAEADLYANYTFDFGLSLGVTDYYYPGTPYFDFSQSSGTHGYEINLGYTLGSLSLAANYMLNQAGAAGTKGGDMYFETTYSFTSVSLFVGAGDGWHTSTGNFAICNIGVSTEKSVKLNDTFSFPLKGSVILNPEKQQFYVVLGVSL